MNPSENLCMPNAKTYEPDENQKMCETKAEKASWSWVVLARSNHTLITRWRGPSRCLRSWAGCALGRCVENAVECDAIYLQHACVSTVKACDWPGGLGQAQYSNVSSLLTWWLKSFASNHASTLSLGSLPAVIGGRKERKEKMGANYFHIFILLPFFPL